MIKQYSSFGDVAVAANGLRLCVCLPLAQGFKLPQMLMGK